MKITSHASLVLVLATMPVACAAETALEPPLPSVETLLQRVAERAKQERENDRAFNAAHSFTRTKVTEYRNARGNLKKREEKTRRHVPVSRSPSSAGPSRAGNGDTDTTQEGNVTEADHTNAHDRAYEEDEFPLQEDLFKRFDLQIVRREILNGRPTLVVDFQPAQRKVPERSLKERFINKTAGRVWVDEQDFAVARANLRLTGKVKVVGGLVGSVSSFTFSSTRERTGDGLWFSRKVDWHLEGRELLFQRIVDYHEETRDVTKAR